MPRFKTVVLVLLLAVDTWAIISSFQAHRTLCIIVLLAMIVITIVQLGSSGSGSRTSSSPGKVAKNEAEFVIDNRTGKPTDQIFRKTAYPNYSVLRTVGNQTDYCDSTGSILSTVRMKSDSVSSHSKTRALHRTGYLITMLCFSSLLLLLAFGSKNSITSNSGADASSQLPQSTETSFSNSYTYDPTTRADANEKDEQTSEIGPEYNVAQFIIAYADARTYSDINIVAPYVEHGSTFYNEQKSFIEKNPANLSLEEYEIVSADYQDEKNCIVSTRETYYVQGKTKTQLVTQACKYVVEKIGNEWLITDYAENVKVLNKIDQ